MTPVPPNPKIYHITHIDNLANIIAENSLLSDASRIANELECSLVGMSTIKERRLNEIEVTCHPGTKVGQYVPFYFCPRSIMLYILHMKNHPELSYRGGQEPIIHLEADLNQTISWANSAKIPWAFSTSNAGSYLTTFHADSHQLTEINWNAINAIDFRDSVTKEGKQAEFLIFDRLPWKLVEKIGVKNSMIASRVRHILAHKKHQPLVVQEPKWYF